MLHFPECYEGLPDPLPRQIDLLVGAVNTIDFFRGKGNRRAVENWERVKKQRAGDIKRTMGGYILSFTRRPGPAARTILQTAWTVQKILTQLEA